MAGSGGIRLKLEAANALAASLGWLGRAPGAVRALSFHDVGDDEADLFGVTRARFGEFLALLKDEGYFTARARDVLSDWPSSLDRDRVILLTFDDGYASHRDVAAEMLSRQGMTATFFAISSFVAAKRLSRAFEGSHREFLSGEDLRHLELLGFEIGSHTHTHPLLGRLPPSGIESELARSREILEAELGHAVASFAYPYGRQHAFSSGTRAALMEAGYRIAFTQAGTRIQRTSDVLALPRTSIDRLDTIVTFRRKLAGDYDLLASLRRYGDPRS